jgi:hypothetical protein
MASLPNKSKQLKYLVAQGFSKLHYHHQAMANKRGTLTSGIPAGTNPNPNFEMNIVQYGNHAASPKRGFTCPHIGHQRQRE